MVSAPLSFSGLSLHPSSTTLTLVVPTNVAPHTPTPFFQLVFLLFTTLIRILSLFTGVRMFMPLFLYLLLCFSFFRYVLFLSLFSKNTRPRAECSLYPIRFSSFQFSALELVLDELNGISLIPIRGRIVDLTKNEFDGSYNNDRNLIL